MSTAKPHAAWRDLVAEEAHEPLFELIAARFRLLSEPLRLKLLASLGDGERSVGELVALTGASQPNVSKHLQSLAQGGIVRRRKAGTSIRYAIADETVTRICAIVCAGEQQRLSERVRILGLTVAPAGGEDA